MIKFHNLSLRERRESSQLRIPVGAAALVLAALPDDVETLHLIYFKRSQSTRLVRRLG